MQPLPIPPVAQTLERFIEGVSPLLNESERAQTQAAAASFAANGAQILQQRLIDYADKEAKNGQSWLTKIKLATYLQDTRPLALSNNASLQLDYPDKSLGTARAASFVHRMVRTHVNYINDDISKPIDPRGQPISMYNWRILTGAVRVPHADGDYYYYAPRDALNRYISVLWQGHHIALQVTDAQGNVFSVAVLEQALEAIMEGEYDKPAFAFTAISALGSAKTAHYLDLLCENPVNKQAYSTLCDSLFCLSLYHFAGSEMQQIHEQTFMPGHAWQFKPMNYQMDLDSTFLAIHFEHSEIDGAALKHMFSYAFALELIDENYENYENYETADTPSTQLLDWVCDKAIATTIKQDVAGIKAKAEQITVQRCSVDYSAINNRNSTYKNSTVKVSHDAMMQLALLYAQLKVFGRVRNTYEAVDTSHFMAGRTEGLRPNSAEAIMLCQALLTNSATQHQLQQAFASHKQRVIAAKTGQAFDRHLTGLQTMIQQGSSSSDDAADKSSADFFASAGYKYLTGGDFLSTSSMGDQSPIKRILFAPTYVGGFGVNYSMNDRQYEFVIFADKQSSEYLDDLCQACIEGADKLIKRIIQ